VVEVCIGCIRIRFAQDVLSVILVIWIK
jgi:hypothetical protein